MRIAPYGPGPTVQAGCGDTEQWGKAIARAHSEECRPGRQIGTDATGANAKDKSLTPNSTSFARILSSLMLLLGLGAAAARADSYPVFGPESYTRGTGSPVEVTAAFTVSSFFLIILSAGKRNCDFPVNYLLDKRTSTVNRLKNWLRTANGWKRLWFVLSAFGLFYMTVVNPFVLSSQNNLSRYQYRWAVEKEFKNPECRLYSIKPLIELTEPEYQDSEGNKGCYHIYNYRKYNNPTKVPYTSDDLGKDFTQELWGEIVALSGLGVVGTMVLSALVYFLGVVVAWVITGFRKKPQ